MSKQEGVNELKDIFIHRKVAQVVLQAVTPLKVASGESDVTIDTPILKNWNNLPMVQGTSLAGVLRASLSQIADQENLFGKDFGSRILVSHLHLVDENMKIHYTLGKPSSPLFLDKYNDLPVREHTAIDHTGVAKDGHKFDEEVVYAGSRFKFELEFITDNSSEDARKWDNLLSELSSPLFRLGSGSTKGFGEMEVKFCTVKEYEIGIDYHSKPSNLNTIVGTETAVESSEKVLTYKILLEPDNFFSFGSGFGDDEVDDIAVTEQIVEWDSDNKGSFSSKQILFPASSLKGALSHRVAFHYNKLQGVYIDDENIVYKEHVGENNDAIATLFGRKAQKDTNGNELGQKGQALFSDMFKTFDENQVKIFDHVKIDRFTGGAMDSALYNEKVIAQKDVWQIEIVLAKEIDGNVKKAFEATLDDLARGWLPLGGKVNRGHGVFVSPDYDEETQNRGWKCMIGGEECSREN